MFLGEGKSYQTFRRNVYENKKGVNKSIILCVREANAKLFECPLLLCCVIGVNQKWENELDINGRNKQR